MTESADDDSRGAPAEGWGRGRGGIGLGEELSIGRTEKSTQRFLVGEEQTNERRARGGGAGGRLQTGKKCETFAPIFVPLILCFWSDKNC